MSKMENIPWQKSQKWGIQVKDSPGFSQNEALHQNMTLSDKRVSLVGN